MPGKQGVGGVDSAGPGDGKARRVYGRDPVHEQKRVPVLQQFFDLGAAQIDTLLRRGLE